MNILMKSQWAALAALPVVLLASCTDERTVEDVEDVLSLLDLRSDAATVNACGGVFELVWEGEAAAPGDPCGECSDGLLACSGSDLLSCVGATEQNVCGGCQALPLTPGSRCGDCQVGTVECTEDGSTTCVGDRDLNLCGGCNILASEPGVDCGTERDPATWRCVSELEVRCIRDDANLCGGENVLSGTIGETCGACGQGNIGCDGTDALACRNEDRGTNACGGCAELPFLPGAPCGDCGGEWQCDGGDGLVCSLTRNACGGCGELGGTPGDACDTGVLTCQRDATLACAPEGGNLCGGLVELDVPPGSPCGQCLDGRTVCLSADETTCVGAGTSNACGGCGTLAGTPGNRCSVGGVWLCDAGQAVCSVELPDANACGGTDTLDGVVGEPCGLCGTGTTECAGANTLRCVGATAAEEFYRYPDFDRDGFGDASAEPLTLCTAQEGYLEDNTDCNDRNERFYPGATEDTCTDTEDYNCDGVVAFTDADNDGSPACLDCDDEDRRRTPGAAEVCDGVDNDCDDLIDEEIGRRWYRDADADGYGVSEDGVRSCEAPAGYVARVGDCDDTTDLRTPSRPEVCDDIDNNCDAVVDGELSVDRQRFYADRDGDGQGDPRAATIEACDAPDGYVTDARDCRDNDDNVFVGAIEVCDGIDNNCDGVTDTDAVDRVTLFVDADADTWGNAAVSRITCPGPGFTARSGDCDDTRGNVFPGASDPIADGLDQDCSGTESCLFEVDGDGYVSADADYIETENLNCSGMIACPAGVAPLPGIGMCFLNDGSLPGIDCDDRDASRSPAATELFADGVDSDCDGFEVCLEDFDNDGFVRDGGVVLSSNASCSDSGEALDGTSGNDCNDRNRLINPDGTELIGDLVDTTCDGIEICYLDNDRDGHRFDPAFLTGGASLPTTTSTAIRCDLPGLAPASLRATDCDDTSNAVYQGAPEVVGNRVDNDCDRQEICFVDADFDSYGTSTTQSTSLIACPTASGFAALTSITSFVQEPGICDQDNRRYPTNTDLADEFGFDSNCDFRDGEFGTLNSTPFSNVEVGTLGDLYVFDSGGAVANGTALRSALGVARAGDVIFVEVGEYQLTSTLNWSKQVSLQGGYTTDANIDGVAGDEDFSGRRYGRSAAGRPTSGFTITSNSALATRLIAGGDFSPTVQYTVAASASVIFDGLQITGANRGTGNGASVALHIQNGQGLTTQFSGIVAGNGGRGNNGAQGSAGSTGGDASGRSGGSSACGTWGGSGAIDTTLTGCGDSCNYTYGAASVGSSSGGGVGGAAGSRGSSVCQRECDGGNLPDNAGNGSAGGGGGNGSCAGSGGAASTNTLGSLNVSGWSPALANSGATGTPGGGGGGGGAGGYYCGINEGGFICGGSGTNAQSGARGGGGGAGGCGGNGGGGGQQGGASIGILVTGSTANITINSVPIQRGTGGQGGNGGNGGSGGSGGSAAAGVNNGNAGGDGASGGNGGRGGGGAGGGAGNGGPSIGIAYAAPAPTISSVSYTGGTAGTNGAPGSGGVGASSLCSAPGGANASAGVVRDAQAF